MGLSAGSWVKCKFIKSDLVYPDSLVPFEMSSDCETNGLLNHFY